MQIKLKIKMSRGNIQSGQSVVEFALSATVLSVLLLAIPMVAKVGTVKLKTNQAVDYVAWRVNKGIHTNNPNELSREVGQRFFSRTGADVLTNRNAECDDAADQDTTGNSIVNWRSVGVEVNAVAESYRDGLEVGNKVVGLDLKEGQFITNVSVPISAVTGIEEIPDTLMINSSMATLSGNWNAKNTTEVKSRVEDSIPLKPYMTVQRPIAKVFNDTIANSFFPLENKIDTDIVKPEILPAGYLKEYR